MSLSDHIIRHVQTAYLGPARERGERTVRVKAGDVHRDLRWANRVPSVCTTLSTRKFQRTAGVELIAKEGPPSGQSTTVVFTYRLPAASGHSDEGDGRGAWTSSMASHRGSSASWAAGRNSSARSERSSVSERKSRDRNASAGPEMSRIYWDSMLFVYMLEAHPRFGPRVRQIHKQMLERGDRLCTSAFTVGEVLTGPQKAGAAAVVAELREYFASEEIDLVPFTNSTAEDYSRIRAAHSVLPADAIHLASAAQVRADLFLTNDPKLLRLHVPGITFIAGLEAKLF